MKYIIKFIILLSMFLNLEACGKKGTMEYPGGQKMPDFEKVIDPGNSF